MTKACPQCRKLNELLPIPTGQEGGFVRCVCGKLYGWFVGDGNEVRFPGMIMPNESIFMRQVG